MYLPSGVNDGVVMRRVGGAPGMAGVGEGDLLMMPEHDLLARACWRRYSEGSKTGVLVKDDEDLGRGRSRKKLAGGMTMLDVDEADAVELLREEDADDVDDERPFLIFRARGHGSPANWSLPQWPQEM